LILQEFRFHRKLSNINIHLRSLLVLGLRKNKSAQQKLILILMAPYPLHVALNEFLWGGWAWTVDGYVKFKDL
jgi:hypothetical protein